MAVEALDADGKTALDRGTLQVVDNQVDQTTGTVRMKAEFPNANLQLWPGQFVNVRVLIRHLKQVVTIPTPAVQRGPNGTFAYVVQADQRVALRPDHGGPADRDHRRHRQGHRRRRAGRDHGLLPSQGRRPRGGRAHEDQPAAGAEPAKAAPARPGQVGSAREDPHRLRRGHAEVLSQRRARQGGMRACLQANAAQLSEPCKAAGRGQAGGKPREADARKAEGSSTQ